MLFVYTWADPIQGALFAGLLGTLVIVLLIAVDDVGTGYSSLAYLSRLPIHELKIDGCSISQMVSNQNDLGIVQNTLKLARTLNLEAVAESVEDNNTRDLLSELSWHRLQGYLFARPIPLDTFCDWAVAQHH